MDDYGDRDMSDDHILMIKLLERHDITVKQLAMWTGYAAPTVYKYRDGHKTIPSIIWRVLYKRTRDPRIVELITGDVPVAVVPLDVGDDDVPSAIAHLLDVREKQIDWEKALHKILADGRIDALDARRIREMKAQFPLMIRTQAQLQQAITRQYAIATK